jgi:hypothetical protein
MHNDKYISVILELPSLKRMSAWERKILRIYGPAVEQGIWRIRNNQELSELCQDLHIITDITQKRWEWNGYVVKRGQGRAVKKYLRVNRRKVEEGEDQD